MCVCVCVWCGDVFLCPYNESLCASYNKAGNITNVFPLPRLSLFAPKNTTGDIAVFFSVILSLCGSYHTADGVEVLFFLTIQSWCQSYQAAMKASDGLVSAGAIAA